MDLLNLKSNTIENINSLFELYFKKEKELNNDNQEYHIKIKSLTDINDKMINEISEKDKIIIIKEKTIYDYEQEINRLSNIREEEENSKERGSMIVTLNKTISDHEKTISSYSKQIEILKNKNKVLEDLKKLNSTLNDSNNESIKIEEVINDNHNEEDCKKEEEKILNDVIEKSIEDAPHSNADDDQIAAGLNEGEYTQEVEDKISEKENDSKEVVDKEVNKEVVDKEVNKEEINSEEEDENILPPCYIVFEYKGKQYCVKDIENASKYYELSDTLEIGKPVGYFKVCYWKIKEKTCITFEDKDEDKKYIFVKNDVAKGNLLGDKIGYIEDKKKKSY